MCDIWLFVLVGVAHAPTHAEPNKLKYLTNKSDKRSCLLVNPLLTMSTPYSREIDRASQSVTPYRSGQAKTLLQYPWHSSAILMSQSFQDWIGQHESNEDMKDVIQVISVFLYLYFLILFQSLASNLDLYEKTSLYNSRSTEFIWSFLCHKAEHSNFAFFDTTQHTAALGNMMLGYQLFDMLAWCNGWSEGQMLREKVSRTIINLPIPAKLATIMNSLMDWTTILPTTQELASEASKYKSSKPLVDLGGSSNSGLVWAISNLLHISKEKTQVAWHKILMNIYAMAFVIRWFSPVRFQSILYSSITNLN
jgi:hypothetical protein